MFSRLKKVLQRLKNHPPGERFRAFHREQKDKPIWVKVAFLGLAGVSFAIGVVLAFIPGPAVLFFALTGALLSTQSRFVAQGLDKGEVWGRKAFASMRVSCRKLRNKHNKPARQRARR